MLEPDYFYGKSDVLISYEQELEDWILQDIAMRLLKAEHGDQWLDLVRKEVGKG